MRDNILKARIKVVGGKELVETFDDFGKHGAAAMKLVDREAEKATKEVQRLKRELDALDRAAKNIRAKIRIDSNKGPTTAQAASLALADRLEAAAAQTRTKLAAAEQALFMEPGQVARTFSAGLNDGADLFDADRIGRELGDALRDADLGEAILSKRDRNAIEKVAENFAKVSAKARDDLAAGISSRDRKAEDVRLQKAEDERIANAEREARKLADAESRLRDEAERENLRRDRAEAARAKITARRRLDAEQETARQVDEMYADLHRQRQLEEDEAEYQRKKRIADEKKAIADFERMRKAALDRAEKEDAVRRKALGNPDAEGGRSGGSRVPAVPDSSEEIGKTGRAASKAARDMDAFSKASDRAGKAVRRIDGGGIGKLFSGISRAIDGTLGDLKKFTTALGSLEYALGNVALRTGVAGIIAAIAAALAALGGGAALAGIAAIAGLAAFDAAKLERAAQALNMTLESFTGLRYAAARAGVAYDDYNSSLVGVRKTLQDIHNGENSAADAAAYAAKYGIDIYSPDRKDVASVKSIIAQVTDLYHKLGPGQERTHMLDSFGLLALEPLIRKTNKGIDALIARAAEVGVVLSSADVEKWEEMRSALWDTWEIIKGIGYALASAISPDLMPVLNAINGWLLDNSDRIVQFLVDSFNYLLQVVIDFWNLFKGRDELVVKAWTKQVWDFGEAVVEAFAAAWRAIKSAYDFAHPALQKLGELIYGTDEGNEGLKLTLTAISAALLGIPGLVMAFARTIGTAFGFVLGAAKRFLLPVLSTVLGIAGWPVLLAGGGVLVWAFWDDVKAAAQSAWNHFKETFPGTAKTLEDAYAAAKPHVESFFQSFAENYPNLAALGEDVSRGLESLQQRLSQWEWGEMGKDGLAVLAYLIDNTFKSLDTLKPLMEYFVVNFVDSVFTLLEALGQVYSWLKAIFTDFASDPAGKTKAAAETVDEQTGILGWLNPLTASIKAWNRLSDPATVEAAASRVADSLGSVPTGFIDPVRQVPMQLADVPAPAAVYQIDWTTPAGDTISTYTRDPAAGRKLNAGQAALSRNPGWNGRRF